VFHFVLGKTVPMCRSTPSPISATRISNSRARLSGTRDRDIEVIGLKENSNKETGVVYVRSTGKNQNGEVVLDYARW